MKAQKIILILFIVLFPPLLFPAQGNHPDYYEDDWVFIPAAYYTPETSVGVVGGILYYFRTEPETNRPSNVPVSLNYTYKNQFKFIVDPTLFFDNENYILNFKFRGVYYPQQFFGIGNNTPSEGESYTEHEISFYQDFQFQILPSLYMGPSYKLQYIWVSDREQDSFLSQNFIPGNESGKVSLAGLILSYDSRDNLFFAKSGIFLQCSADFSHSFLSSDYDYQQYKIDFRQYIPLFSSHALAFQEIIHITVGTVPFQNLPSLGGHNLLRGIFYGRFREKTLLAAQTEYRAPLWKRLHLVFMAGIGQVGETLYLNNPKTAFGAGLRFRITEEGMNLRLDSGYSPEGKEIRFYFTVLEAF
jgi:outer membrane protein assembly factor BamA